MTEEPAAQRVGDSAASLLGSVPLSEKGGICGIPVLQKDPTSAPFK